MKPNEITISRETVTVVPVRFDMAALSDDGVLATATAGLRARDKIERAIAELKDDQVVVLDFNNVRVVSVPFADVSVGHLLSGRAAGYYEGHPIVIANANDDVRQTLSATLRLHHLHALSLSESGPELLGADETLANTLQAAASLRTFEVHDLAKELRLTPQAANNRLRTLMRTGAVQRERVNPERGGRAYRYRVPTG